MHPSLSGLEIIANSFETKQAEIYYCSGKESVNQSHSTKSDIKDRGKIAVGSKGTNTKAHRLQALRAAIPQQPIVPRPTKASMLAPAPERHNSEYDIC